MNKIFKVIWNPATGSYSVASETAKSRGKKSGRSKLLISAVVAGGLLSPFAYADNATGTPVVPTGHNSGNGWVAIGEGSTASQHTGLDGASTAIGNLASALGKYSTSIGARSSADGDASTALGVNAKATGNRGTAIGASAKAEGQYSMAMGVLSLAKGDYASAFGFDNDAIGEKSLALGYKSSSSAQYSVAIGADASAEGVDAIAAGRESEAKGTDSLALGRNSLASAANAIAIGADSEAGENATAVGFNADATGKSSLALGDNASAGETNSIAIGQNSRATKVGSIALGSGSTSAGENAIALGNDSNAGGKSSLAFGVGASANGDNAVAIGANSIADADNTVSVGSLGSERKIVNMGKGDINKDSTDAINGSQLYAISKSVSDRLGGFHADPNNVINSDGTLKAPTYYLQSGQYNNVGEALQGIDNNTLHWDEKNKKYSASHTTFNTDGSKKNSLAQSVITDVADGLISEDSFEAVNGSQLYDLKQDSLLWDSNAGAFSAAHGDPSTVSKITNLDAGTISSTSTDAINGTQLQSTAKTITSYLGGGATMSDTGVFAAPTYNIGGQEYHNVGGALEALEDDALFWDATAKSNAGAFSAGHGKDNSPSIITNVANGAVSSTSTDAVNGSQLNTTNNNVSALTTTVEGIDGTVDSHTLSIDALEDDALQWDSSSFSAKHGPNGTDSKITNLLAGTVSSTSTDAINGSQLYSLADSFTTYLGGGADISDTGELTGPTYTIGGKPYTNVGAALEAINTSFSASLGDALLWDTTANKFSAKHGGTASVITDVADGVVSNNSSDAINGSQLYDTNKYIADALGGNAKVNADGSIAAPTYTIAGGSYNNVGEALDALDDNALLWDDAAGAYSANHKGNASKITNVADGLIEAGSTDAVNGSQLNAANLLIEQNSQIINQLAGNTDTTYIAENGAGINYVRTNDDGLAFNDASASGIGATAVGYNAVASGASSVAIGQDSISEVDTGIALGSSSVSDRVIVKGSRNTSVTENGVEIGYDTTDGELLGALSIGDDGKYRQIINVADGSEAHDAVTVRQLQNAIGAVATTPTKYFHANSTAEDSLAVGEDSLAMGAKTIVNGNAGIGIGLNTLVLADAINGIAIGSNARANHANSIAMGNGSQTTRGAQTGYTGYNMDAPQNSVGEFSVGSEDGQRQITNVAAGSADTDAVNVGQLKVTDERVAQNTQSITNLNTQVTNLDTRVTNIENGIGDIVTTGSTKYFKTNTTGVDANAQGQDSVAIGSGSIAAADNSVALGTGSVADEENTISVGSSTNQRRITNVAAGKNATDAVNVAQLKSSEAGGVRYDTKSDGSVDYSSITLGGGSGGTTRISNVSAGVNNNDAVNYAQLKQSVQETKQYTDQRMVEMDNKLSKTESKLSGGIASAMAMTGLPQAYTPGASMASIGGGTYNGESAVALGVSMVSANGRWVYKLQGSTNSQGEYSAALGAGIQW
ncbi:adhesin [Escherichia sp. E14V7]|uniref:YadA-like family protein n=1 Tax=unclassified Escherichia TaxID=2608889 RepID=UPI00102A54FC|nr:MULTISPECIES: YadA-like family protein [unclassified Escherichia]RZM97869.1 adhesin [Escherichia sp. E14V5]RZN01195.1 adhesin [Escherichia sp. E14V7]RZN26135.1 adhesin [Escherichia sp. E14V10]TGB56530.1 adhesin [Escherichia sp. E5028]